MMNRSEIGSKIADFLYGRKVEGTVSAVLRTENNHTRYVITTEQVDLDVTVPPVQNYGLGLQPMLYTITPPLGRNDGAVVRSYQVRQWVDGQQI